MTATLLDQVYNVYRDQRTFDNPTCINCVDLHGDGIIGPVPLPHIGKEYEAQTQRLLILSEYAIGYPDTLIDYDHPFWEALLSGKNQKFSRLQDSLEQHAANLFFGQGRVDLRYWKYIRQLCEILFGDAQTGYDRIALSFIAHCGPLSHRKLPSQICYLCGEGLLSAELRVLAPTKVLAISRQYEYLIPRMFNKPNHKVLHYPSPIDNQADKLLSWFLE